MPDPTLSPAAGGAGADGPGDGGDAGAPEIGNCGGLTTVMVELMATASDHAKCWISTKRLAQKELLDT